MSGLNQKRIVVLMGGASSEREISLHSGHAVFEALHALDLDVVALDLSQDTRLWHGQLEAVRADVAFIALHGTYGEDGCIQGLLESMQITYTSSGVLASALCMNKRLTKSVLQHQGMCTPETVMLEDGCPISYPVFVKPIAEGSSVGLHYVENQAAWLALDIQDMTQWLVEVCVVGVEVAVSVLHGKALPPVEVVPKSGVYDYASKYTQGATHYYCPARLADEKVKQCQTIAAAAVNILGCLGAPRVDFIVPQEGQPVVLEVNTIPGMTTTSLLPKAAAQIGMTFANLCVSIIEEACRGEGV